jgi:uncharacterized protein YprB with RNaseH-like and TPR domain
MDNTNILIARLYNEGASLDEIITKVQERTGESLSRHVISSRIYRMKDGGTLDNTRSDPQDEDILNEIEKAAGGGFLHTGVLDIETTGLWSDFGYVLCAVIKDMETGKHEVFRLDETPSYNNPQKRKRADFWRRVDGELLKLIVKAYEQYDLVIHFNGRNFDVKFLNTRLIKNNLPILPEMKQLDIYQIAKHRLRIRSKRLDALKEFLEIDHEDEGHKWEYWQMAGAGVKEGFDYVVHHCIRDTDRLSEVAKRMKVFINYIRK